VKHLLRYLRGTSDYKLTIYNPSLGHDSKSILCYADADMGGAADTSKSTSGIVVYALGTLVIWKSKKQSVVAQLTMQADMIATAYGKVQINWLRDLISEIGIGRCIRHILNDGLNCVTTLNSGNFQSDSRPLRLRYHSTHEAIAKVRSRSNTWQVRRCWQTLSLTPSGELNSANLWRRLDSDRITGRIWIFWISFVSDCVFGFALFSLDLDLTGFGTWRRILDFRLFLWFCFVWKALGQRGSVD
jgi:hypothetical protein